MMRRLLALVAMMLPTIAVAQEKPEIELSFYLGIQEAPHSRVEGTSGGSSFNFLSEWEGRSGEAPPYYGLRLTWWRSANLGYGLEINHAKVYASDETLADNGFDNLELTDGINIITANVFYRWPALWGGGALTPYVGGGLGISVPHVDVEIGPSKTFEYQLTGPAAMWAAGVSYGLNENWALFAEYKGTYSMNEMDLEGGGKLETDIVTNALNLGVSYTF